jgi:predicted nuclease of predicted toxin-antitoxin system
VGSLTSELRPIAADLAAAPRVYADANLPRGAIAFMRQGLGWDVLAVIEEPDLRRAADREHFARARDLGRTLITLDRDFLDSRRFRAADSPGVLICTAPDEARLTRLLQYVDREVLRRPSADLPLLGQITELTMEVLVTPPAAKRRKRRSGRPRRRRRTRASGGRA